MKLETNEVKKNTYAGNLKHIENMFNWASLNKILIINIDISNIEREFAENLQKSSKYVHTSWYRKKNNHNMLPSYKEIKNQIKKSTLYDSIIVLNFHLLRKQDCELMIEYWSNKCKNNFIISGKYKLYDISLNHIHKTINNCFSSRLIEKHEIKSLWDDIITIFTR